MATMSGKDLQLDAKLAAKKNRFMDSVHHARTQGDRQIEEEDACPSERNRSVSSLFLKTIGFLFSEGRHGVLA